MADTYEKIIRESEGIKGNREKQIDHARAIWYRGWIAEEIDQFCRSQEVMDVSGRRHKGLLTVEDMANWEATYDKPVTYDYGNYTVCKCGPWSQGPVLLQQLAILDGLGVGSMDPTGPDFVHTVVESAKLAFADREAYYGDPTFIDVPMTELLSSEYNKERRALIGQQA